MREYRRNLERTDDAPPRDTGRFLAGDIRAVVENGARSGLDKFGPISA
jgi:hypothetical protein